MDWDKLRVFHAVAEAGSFTHAGDTLNLSQSAVSRQISALEEALQVPLFHRHARGLILTEQGESLNRTVREVFAKLAMTEALLTESKEKPAGRLKVTTTVGFGASWLAPRIQSFLDAYPDVTMTLILDDADLDLAMREADVAIRMHPPKQPDLVQRHLLAMEWHICASPDYLKKHGTPLKGEDLDSHRLVLFGDYRPPVADINWLADLGRRPGSPRRALLEVNSLHAMVMAVRSGIGIAALPDYMAAEEEANGMVRVLAEVKAPKVDVYFVYPEELRTSKRVAVFRDFLLARLVQRGVSHADTAPATVEIANLGANKTGVDGVMSISTAQGGPGPRVTWYPGRPAAGAPCLSMTIEATPRAFNHHLPQQVFTAATPAVSAWVALNHRALADFWANGATWLDDEVTAFKAALRKLA